MIGGPLLVCRTVAMSSQIDEVSNQKVRWMRREEKRGGDAKKKLVDRKAKADGKKVKTGRQRLSVGHRAACQRGCS